MPTTFRPYHPDQVLLLPPSLKEWLPEDHLVHFISDTVDSLNLSKLYERYSGDGRRRSPYEPRMMLKVLLYGYSTGTFSSRKMARRIEDEVAFRYLAAGNMPDFRTINQFRKGNLVNFQDIFVQVVRVAQELGLVRLGTIAVDGSKLNANASKRKAMSYGRMKQEEARLKQEIEELTNRAEALDAQEDMLYGADKRGDELPPELARRSDRLQKIQEAKQRLEERQKEEDKEQGRSEDDDNNSSSGIRPQGGRSKYRRDFGVPPDKKQENFTDSESRIMKTSRNGFQQCYNAQIAVDAKHQLIVATALDNNAADAEYLIPIIEEVERVTQKTPDTVLADSGYRSEENFKELAQRKIRGLIPLGREGKAETKINPDLKLTQRMARRLKSKDGEKRYRRRKAIVEAPFGWIKNVLGFVSFSLRSKWKCASEWSLVCSAVNLKRLANLMCWKEA